MGMRYFGVLNGSNLAPSGIQDREAVLVIDSLDHAESVLRRADNQDGDRSWIMRGLDGRYPGDIPGGLGEGSTLTLYAFPLVNLLPDDGVLSVPDRWEVLRDSDDPYPDYVLTVGPRGGIKVERA